MAPLTETRERFLRAILQRVPAERLEELHLFSPIRQGGVESGVAVLAVRPAPSATEALVADDVDEDALEDDEVVESREELDEHDEHEELESLESLSAHDEGVVPSLHAPVAVVRHTVFTARYRLVLKGPDRGKWEVGVVDEAEAPLLTVDTVVRGVQRRAGDTDAADRFDGASLHALLARLARPGS